MATNEARTGYPTALRALREETAEARKRLWTDEREDVGGASLRAYRDVVEARLRRIEDLVDRIDSEGRR